MAFIFSMVLKFLYHGYYSSVLLLSQYHYIDSTLHSPVQTLLLPLATECILGTVRLSNHWGISPNPVIQRRCLRLWC